MSVTSENSNSFQSIPGKGLPSLFGVGGARFELFNLNKSQYENTKGISSTITKPDASSQTAIVTWKVFFFTQGSQIEGLLANC